MPLAEIGSHAPTIPLPGRHSNQSLANSRRSLSFLEYGDPIEHLLRRRESISVLVLTSSREHRLLYRHTTFQHQIHIANASLLITVFVTPLALDTAQQSSVPQIHFYGYDTQSIDASIVGVSNSVTTLQLACLPGTDSSEHCVLFLSQTLPYGPSTYSIKLGVGSAGSFTRT